MRTPLEIRNDALHCLRQADRAPAPQHKAVLLILAQGWASLADEMERRGLTPEQVDCAAAATDQPDDATTADPRPATAD